MAETSSTVVRRYVADAIALERDLETRLEGFADAAADGRAQKVYRTLAASAKNHRESLEARVEELGGSAPAVRSFIEQIFGLRAKHLLTGHEDRAMPAESVVSAFAAENSAIALYEVLLAMTEAAGDSDTGKLVRSIQKEKKLAAENLWQLLPGTALQTEEAGVRARAMGR